MIRSPKNGSFKLGVCRPGKLARSQTSPHWIFLKHGLFAARAVDRVARGRWHVLGRSDRSDTRALTLSHVLAATNTADQVVGS